METPTHTAPPVALDRLVRVPWSAEEDEDIKILYAYANGGFMTYKAQASRMNEQFHGGKPVRTAAAVRRREGKLLSGSANDKGMAPGSAVPTPDQTNKRDR